MHRPALVLADEPTDNLDPGSVHQLLALLRDTLKRERAAGLLVRHSMQAARSADRVLILGAAGLRPARGGGGSACTWRNNFPLQSRFSPQ